MAEEISDWRVALKAWLEGHGRTIPEPLAKLRTEFVQKFPREALSELTLEQYAVGRPDSFCYWIEFKTHDLGSVAGGNAGKWGIYWSNCKQSWQWNKFLESTLAEEAFQKVQSGLKTLIETAAKEQNEQLDAVGSKRLGSTRNGLRSKPLSLYFPDKFLPISSPYHLTHFLNFFGQKSQGGLHTKNRQLLHYLRAQPEFDGVDTYTMMAFLYEVIPPGKTKAKSKDDDDLLELSEELVQIVNLAENTRNIILYGPPGTGKTYTVNRFAQFYLNEQLSVPISPEQRRKDLIVSLNWYQAIALAMYQQRSQKALFRVPEIAADPIIHDFRASTKTKNLNSQLHAMLQTHTSPDVATVKYKNRQPPFLFEKTEQSEWHLTEEGKEYVELELDETLAALNHPNIAQPDISSYVRFVTFHQSFSYEEFVEGLKPVAQEGQVLYEVEDGVFKALCKRAQNDPEHSYLLVIDEINRANIAKVFGELITLIEDDKRLEGEHEITVQLPYSKDAFGVPENLLIIGTMNTADRSVALLDIALRRRFSFVEQMPDPSLLSSVEEIDLARLLTRMNQRITVLLGRDYQIGHSYLMGVTNVETLHFAWYQKIMPLLQEYFYGDWERLKAVVGDRFIKAVEIDAETQKALGDFYDEFSQWEIEEYDAGSAFLEALKGI